MQKLLLALKSISTSQNEAHFLETLFPLAKKKLSLVGASGFHYPEHLLSTRKNKLFLLNSNNKLPLAEK